ncbi:BT_3987 domain-containing protein [Bacteroides finegoldii]|jgi:hypothetical protein|uniref:BT_3987 domain-containing protein n=1 Tax=Bacteroides finegoldii TaxID=338188 RepID=UPI002431A244|nr:DUF1735 domain-containing protein [Bacteroides finegoldii]
MKIKNTLLLAGSLFLLAACAESKYDLESLVPDQYHKILYVNNSGKQQVTLYDTGEKYAYTFSIFKSGSAPDQTASVDVYTLTQEELDSEYSGPEAVNYKLMDTDCYSIAETHLDFLTTDRCKSVTVSLDPEHIKSAIAANPDVVWVLPLVVTSENDSINSDKNELFLQIAGVITPSLGFENVDVSVKDYNYGTGISEKIVLGLDTENSWNIDCTFNVVDTYREEYNTKNNTLFQTLPEGTYSFDGQMTLPSGTTNAELNVTINASQLQPGDYMLPICIKTVSMFEISPTKNIYPLTVRILGPKLERTAWTIEANTQEPNGEGTGNGIPVCALDGNTSTYWHSSWQSGTHALPHELIIDTNDSYVFTQFGLMQRQDPSYTDTGSGVFYVSDDKTNWTEVGKFTMKKILGLQNFTVETPMKGRYFKVQITESNRGLNTSLSEIYAYGLFGN